MTDWLDGRRRERFAWNDSDVEWKNSMTKLERVAKYLYERHCEDDPEHHSFEAWEKIQVESPSTYKKYLDQAQQIYLIINS